MRNLKNRPAWRRSLWGAAAAVTAIGLLSASTAASAASIVLYSAQHEQTVDLLVSAFEKQTGIQVKVHSGDGPEVANQIVEEGSASPADVFFTENSPEIDVLAEKGLLAKVDPSTLAVIPSKYNAPDGSWVGVLAREDVLAYNTSMISAASMPASLMDLAKPEWKGKIAIAPSDNDFLPLVNAVVVTHGRAAALDWLKGLKNNAKFYDDDEGVVAAVNSGAVATGIINNYYWARLQEELGKAQMHSALYHFKGGDVGGLINISGAGVLKTSKDPADAQKFLAFLVSEDAQKMLADKPVNFEYPLHPGVAPNPVLMPFNELQPPAISVAQLGDDAPVVELLHEAGLF